MYEVNKKIKSKNFEKGDLRRKFIYFIKRREEKIKIIDEHWCEDRTRWVFFISVNQDKYSVEIRGRSGIVSNLGNANTSKDEAFGLYLKAIETRVITHFQVIDNYYPTAKKFIQKYSDEKKNGDYSLFKDRYSIQFILAVAELTEEGFVIEAARDKPIKVFDGKMVGKPKVFFTQRKARNRYISRQIPNFKFIPDAAEMKDEMENLLKKMATNEKLKESSLTSYYSHFLWMIEKVHNAYPAVYKPFSPVKKLLYSYLDEFISQNVKSGLNKDGILGRRCNHPMMTIENLEIVLDRAFDTSIGLFNFILLSLSTTLRPTEVRRLLSLKKTHILDGGYLDYKSGDIIIKTVEDVDPSELTNPSLSILSRVLLKYDHRFANAELITDFFKPDKYFRKDIGLEGFYERSLRTTAGHMIGFCIKAKDPHKGDIHVVKDRMGHKTVEMAINKYAKNLPHQSKTPEAYFKCAGMTKDGLLITAHQPLWDAYLLEKWVQKMCELYTEDNIKIIWNQIMTEARAHLSIVAPDENTFIPKNY